jgi:hypothetical protein
MNRMNRRTMLRGAAGTAIALPWLEAMNVRKAFAAPGVSDTGFPKRFIVWSTCNGFHPPIWNPGGGETDFVLRPVHKTLEPFRKDMVMVAGLNDAAFGKSGGDLHSRGMCTFMSGTESIVNTAVNTGLGGESKSSGGITLDQEIVKRLAPRTKFPSLEMTFLTGSGPYGTTSYLDASKPLSGAKDPAAVFKRIFADGTGNGPAGDPAAAARLQTERRSILDAVGKTYQGLLPKLGLADRDKVDSHLTQIRDLEKRLQVVAPAAGGGGAAVAGCPKTVSAPAGSDRPAQAAAFVDLLATAIACDLTRVSSMQWDMTTGNSVYSWLGVSRGHHDMSHDGDDRADTVAELTKIHTFYTEHLARLVTRLKAIPEGNGTALDNTLILHATDLGRGNNGHTGTNKYHMLLGHAGGALKNGGRVLRYTGDANNKLFVSILNMFDVPATTFGNASLSSGPLARL